MLDYFRVYVICDVCDFSHKYAILCTAIHRQPLSFMRRWKCQNIPRSGLFLKIEFYYIAVESQRLYDTLHGRRWLRKHFITFQRRTEFLRRVNRCVCVGDSLKHSITYNFFFSVSVLYIFWI